MAIAINASVQSIPQFSLVLFWIIRSSYARKGLLLSELMEIHLPQIGRKLYNHSNYLLRFVYTILLFPRQFCLMCLQTNHTKYPFHILSCTFCWGHSQESFILPHIFVCFDLCIVSNFQVKIAIIGITAGGVGLDFSSAKHVVFLELPQSPSLMLQV